MARHGAAWLGAAQFGMALHGSAWLCMARHGSARHGSAWRGKAQRFSLALSSSHDESLNDEPSLYDSLPLYREEAVSSP